MYLCDEMYAVTRPWNTRMSFLWIDPRPKCSATVSSTKRRRGLAADTPARVCAAERVKRLLGVAELRVQLPLVEVRLYVPLLLRSPEENTRHELRCAISNERVGSGVHARAMCVRERPAGEDSS